MYKEIYLQALKEHFGLDYRRINHALKVLDAAESIMAGEGVNGLLHKIIVITALLHDVGIKVAEEKYGSSSGSYQEQEGPPIVRNILACHGEDTIVIERVAYIVGNHHTATKINGIDFQIIWEADWLVNIEEENLVESSQLSEILARNFKTRTGRSMAQELYT